MFDAMAEWMTVPLLLAEGGKPFKRIGLAHAAIAPYGVFKTRDGADILIAIQNDREWRVLAEKVLGDAALGSNPKFATNPKRVDQPRRDRCRRGARFSRAHDVEPLMQKLEPPTSPSPASTIQRCCRSIRICAGSRSTRRPARLSMPAPAPICVPGAGAQLRRDPGARRAHERRSGKNLL